MTEPAHRRLRAGPVARHRASARDAGPSRPRWRRSSAAATSAGGGADDQQQVVVLPATGRQVVPVHAQVGGDQGLLARVVRRPSGRLQAGPARPPTGGWRRPAPRRERPGATAARSRRPRRWRAAAAGSPWPPRRPGPGPRPRPRPYRAPRCTRRTAGVSQARTTASARSSTWRYCTGRRPSPARGARVAPRASYSGSGDPTVTAGRSTATLVLGVVLRPFGQGALGLGFPHRVGELGVGPQRRVLGQRDLVVGPGAVHRGAGEVHQRLRPAGGRGRQHPVQRPPVGEPAGGWPARPFPPASGVRQARWMTESVGSKAAARSSSGPGGTARSTMRTSSLGSDESGGTTSIPTTRSTSARAARRAATR